MIIKNIVIKNFLCYFAENKFSLSNGLNIILSENGEGKTKFYEAIDWLLNGDNRNLDLLISAKALKETAVNDRFTVLVEIEADKFDSSYTVTKSFEVIKKSKDDYSTSNYSVDGVEENRSGERTRVDGNNLLDKLFPHEIRRYSMFKGEAELDIFSNSNEEALSILINSFSSAKYYEKYSKIGEFLRDKAEKAVNEAAKRDEKSQKEYKRIELEIEKLSHDKSKFIAYINSNEDQIKKLETHIQEAEKYVENAEALETINKRIKYIEEEKVRLYSNIDENYTTALFDNNWILVNYEKIHQELDEKIKKITKEKRKQQQGFDKEIGIKEGKKLLKAELLNNSIPLPIGVPSKAHMEEMIKDELCKVCNRPAEKGSEPYEFMLKRLEEYLKSQKTEDTESDIDFVLFKNNYLDRIFNLYVNHEDNLAHVKNIKGDIKSLFEFNEKRRLEIEELEEKLQVETREREKIIGKSTIGAEKLSIILKNYNKWQNDIAKLKEELLYYQQEVNKIEEELIKLKKQKDEIDITTANTFLIKTRTILRDIETIFKDIKDRKFDEFINLLETKSNKIFSRINVDAFTGTIVFKKKKSFTGKTDIIVELQENGRTFHKPNQSLETSMHISILFAISELAYEYREESYPLIFDAPTSSFGETKTAEFLDLLYETENQKILLIKDFIAKDEGSKNLYIKKEFDSVKKHKAFWVRLERPFDKNILSTINSEVIPL